LERQRERAQERWRGPGTPSRLGASWKPPFEARGAPGLGQGRPHSGPHGTQGGCEVPGGRAPRAWAAR
jgi:hypothetical protein